MWTKELLLIAVASSLLQLASCATYHLEDNYVGKSFLTGFTHEAIADPTHGRVNYVDEPTALAKNLTFVSDSALVLRSDASTKLTASGPGRDSVRIQSVKGYSTHVAIFDIRHMPQGCGTWPAAWEVGSNWPNEGEVDVVEGVNDVVPNLSSLHTSAGCSMPAQRSMTGQAASNDCNVADNGNTGCGVKNNKANNYGPPFNKNGGGWYAMERTNDFIRVFFWARDDSRVPADVKSGGKQVDTGSWGTPVVLFPSTQCAIPTHFGEHSIIINLTFCGDFAGDPANFQAAGCPGTCAEFVNNNPTAFKDAYWDIAAIRVYT